MLDALLIGFQLVLTPEHLLLILAGTLLGVFAGAMPGLSSSVGLAIVLPFTSALPPTTAILMLVALYMAAQYGVSITAIVIGVIPGAGATIASLIAWNEEKRFSKTPEAFGKGALRGVAAPEAANNSSVGAAMIPLLTLGIPGSASTAVLLGGLMLHGISPGPLLVTEHAEIVYAIYAGFFVAVLCMFVVGLLGIPLWTRIISLPTSTLTPLILGISIIGSFASRGNLFDVWLMLTFGVLGHVMLRCGLPLVPAVLGLVLGGMVEANYRRALAISSGSHITFLTSPISLVILLLAVASFAAPVVRRKIMKEK